MMRSFRALALVAALTAAAPAAAIEPAHAPRPVIVETTRPGQQQTENQWADVWYWVAWVLAHLS